MSALWIALAFGGGLLAASSVWTLADKIIRGFGLDLWPVCLNCGARQSPVWWLPLSRWALGRGECTQCGDRDKRPQRNWQIVVALYYALAIGVVDIRYSVLELLILSLPVLLILAIDIKVEAVFIQTCFVAIVAGISLAALDGSREAVNALIGMILAVSVTTLFLAISRWLFRSLGVRVSPIGLSDVYVAAAVGAVVRSDTLVPALVVTVSVAAAYGVLVPLMSKGARGRVAPFGPFLCTGALAALILA
ncbi:hypothetical protein BH23CHL5_BH23CHL5_07380 [soil metagenome]